MYKVIKSSDPSSSSKLDRTRAFLMIISQNVTNSKIICEISWSSSLRGGPTQDFWEKVDFLTDFSIFCHRISVGWVKHLLHHEDQSFFFQKWAYSWSDHAYLSIYHVKHEDSCSKSSELSGKMSLFFLSLFFLKYLCRQTSRDLNEKIRWIISKLVVFHDIRKTHNLSCLALEGGGVWTFDHPVVALVSDWFWH